MISLTKWATLFLLLSTLLTLCACQDRSKEIAALKSEVEELKREVEDSIVI